MFIGNGKAIDQAARKHAQLRRPLAEWVAIVEKQTWTSIVDARKTFPTADAIKKTPYTCFNIGGNNFRLIAIVSYSLQQVRVVEILTHAEYSRKY